MSEPCKTCGSELFAGQRFCRACGNPTDTLDMGDAPTQHMPATGEAPTQRMPQPPDDWGAHGQAHTAPQSRPDTRPVGQPPPSYQAPNPYQAPPTSYQLPPQPLAWQQPRYPPQPLPATTGGRSGSPWAIVLAVFLAILLGTIIGGRVLYNRIRSHIPPVSSSPSVPGVPAPAVQTVALNKGAAVTIKTISGDITVESWNQPQAEIQIISNSSNVPQSAVKVGGDNNSLDLIAPSSGNVSFKVKLPKELGTVTFNTASGAIKLTNVAGRISIATASGDLTLNNVSGLERIATASGDITGTLSSAAKDHPMTIDTASGDIRLTLQDQFNANLDARTISGDIETPGFDGVTVAKTPPVGTKATGIIGSGGQTLTIKTASGDIHLSK